MKTPSPRHGFTLLELLVVVAILAILAVTSIGVMGNVRERGREAQCLQKMRQIHQALLAKVHDNNGIFPSLTGNPAHSSWARNWSGDLVFSGYFGHTSTDVWNIFRCPSAPLNWSSEGFYVHYGLNSYLAPADSERNFGRMTQVTSPQRTVMLTDSAFPNGTSPTSGFYVVVNYQRVHDRHRGKANFIFVDGHAEAIPPSEDLGPAGHDLLFAKP